MKKEVKLACGYKCKIDERVANDFDLLWKLRKMDDGDYNSIFDVLAKLFGDDDKIEKLMDCLRDKDGYVATDKIAEAIVEAINALGDDGKNS